MSAAMAPDLSPGWMDEEERDWLREQARRMDSALEIGCWLGLSASALAEGCPGPVFTVDHFRGSPSEPEQRTQAGTADVRALATLTLHRYPNVCIVALDSLTAARFFAPASVDLVFIDGEHTEDAVYADLMAWRPVCRRLLCGHDVGMPGVHAALDRAGISVAFGPGSLWYVNG